MISDPELTFWLIGGGFIPGIIWLIFFYIKDMDDPDTTTLLLFSYLAGILVVLPVGIISLFYGRNPFINSVISAPIVEEFFKFIVFYYFIFSKKSFKKPIQGLINGVAVALGFASFENGIYLLRSFHANSFGETFILRGIFSVPAHALISGFWAYYFGKYKFLLRSKSMLVFGLICSMLAHSIFNFIVFLGNASMIASLFFIATYMLILWLIMKINFDTAKRYRNVKDLMT